MNFVRAREFLLGAYRDLPNVLFVGSLILGSVMGYVPLLWVSLGLILNGATVSIFQGLLSMLFPTWAQVSVAAGSTACEILGRSAGLSSKAIHVVAPSHWLAAAAFFATFTIFNSIQVALKAPVAGADPEKVDMRRAFSFSVMFVGIIFFSLVLMRGFSGCETWLGSISGVLVGSGMAVGFWYLLDACGTGKVPDVLQIMNSLPPSADTNRIPVVCTPPPTPDGSYADDASRNQA